MKSCLSQQRHQSICHLIIAQMLLILAHMTLNVGQKFMNAESAIYKHSLKYSSVRLSACLGFHPSKRIYDSVHISPRLVRVAEPSVHYGFLPGGVVLNSWRSMTDELLAAGYSITKISQLTGVPRRTVQRWFEGEDIPNHPRLFSRVLNLYCYYKYSGGCNE
jgi:hypothetical protein